MLKIEIDGREIEVPHGSTVMDATNQLGIYVPHFCYHRKLSIAANCRMCLVEVEKAPKPLPACATPVTDGMKVKTSSAAAKQAQNGVMEFLLINHPLDCPICDQGGECQLQDLAVGYGNGASRYAEEKRVVLAKDVGPLVAAEEMSRCIQCTRCVRFGQEIAGVMELGMVGRGEHSEIVAFVGRTVDSELSGNMIDLCPVGALTSKPFRYSARTWELARRKSVSPHDGLGANLVVQVKQNKVMRVLPLENEAVNECWLSDKDRFSYEALDARERLTEPMLKRDGRWEAVEWPVALDFVTSELRRIQSDAGGAAIGGLATPHSTLEELSQLGRLMRGLGSENVDFRLRQSDFSADGQLAGIPWLGMSVAGLDELDRVLVVGSFLRKDHPLIAQRLRQVGKRCGQISILHSADDDLLMKVAHKLIVSPSEFPAALASIAQGATGAAAAILESLKSGEKKAILLGNFAQQHAQAAQIHALAQALAETTGAALGFLGEAANSVGGYLAGCVPTGQAGAMNARSMLEQPRKAYLLLNAEPELDCGNPQAALAAMRSAELVVALSAFDHRAREYANVMLPIAPFTETAGTFISTEGRLQGFHGCVRPAGEARPGWKVLRVLGSMLGIAGFDEISPEQVRDACLAGKDVASRLSNATRVEVSVAQATAGGLQRVADVPIYFADALVRRAPSLQRTKDAQVPHAGMNAGTLAALGLSAGQPVRVRQGDGSAELVAALDAGLPDQCVRVAAAHSSTASLGAMSGVVTLERLSAQQAA
ncbi:MAG: NADH-quinone oxidoreductase subunit G [Betaproteobacteria bacterium]|nr:NADH-quinone oxidoreductase subunit G [Betaproteobacteria bacterium]